MFKTLVLAVVISASAAVGLAQSQNPPPVVKQNVKKQEILLAGSSSQYVEALINDVTTTDRICARRTLFHRFQKIAQWECTSRSANNLEVILNFPVRG